MPRSLIAILLAVSLAVVPNDGARAQNMDRAVGAVLGAIIGGAVREHQRSRPQQRRGSMPAISTAQRQETREVQAALNFFEFNAGSVDGVMGPNTRRAIRSFQRHLGFRVTGRLDEEQRAFLLDCHRRAERTSAQSVETRILRHDGPQALLLHYYSEAQGEPARHLVGGTPTTPPQGRQTPVTGVRQEHQLRIIGVEGIEGRLDISLRLDDGGATITLEAVDGAIVAMDDALPASGSAEIELGVVARALPECDQGQASCAPIFTATSAPVMMLEADRIIPHGFPAEIVIPESALAATAEIAFLMFSTGHIPDSSNTGMPVLEQGSAIALESPGRAAPAAVTQAREDLLPLRMDGVARSREAYDCLRQNSRADFRACLEDAGESEATIAAAMALTGDGGPTLLTNYFAIGPVDVAQTETLQAGSGTYFGLVRDNREFLSAESLFEPMRVHDRASRSLQRRHPQAAALNAAVVSGHRYMADATQRFVLTAPITDGCRGCDLIATAIGYVDFRHGRLVDSGTIGWLPLVDARRGLYGPALLNELRRGNVAALQAALNLRGYAAGAMDSAMGPNTRRALHAFQQDHCLRRGENWRQHTAEMLAGTGEWDEALTHIAACGPPPALPSPSRTYLSGEYYPGVPLPLREGVYATEARYCDPDSPGRRDIGDAFSTVLRPYERNILSYYEAYCGVRDYRQVGEEVEVSRFCEAEGYYERSISRLRIHDETSFSDQSGASGEAAPRFTHCEILTDGAGGGGAELPIGPGASPAEQLATEPLPELGDSNLGLSINNSGADLFNIFTHIMAEYCVGHECTYFDTRAIRECETECSFTGVEGRYVARAVRPEQILELMQRAGEQKQMLLQMGLPYGFPQRINESDASRATGYQVFRSRCETDVCSSLLLLMLSENEGFVVDIAEQIENDSNMHQQPVASLDHGNRNGEAHSSDIEGVDSQDSDLHRIENYFTSALGVDSEAVQQWLIDAELYEGDFAPYEPDGRHVQWTWLLEEAFQAALDHASETGMEYDLSSEEGYYDFVRSVRDRRLALADGSLLSRDQATEHAIDILMGAPYGHSRSEVRQHFEEVRFGVHDICGGEPAWIFEVRVPDPSSAPGQPIEGYLVINSQTGLMICAGLPFLD